MPVLAGVMGAAIRGGTPPWLLPQVVGNGIQYEFTAGPKYWLGSGLTAGTNVLADTRASDALFDNEAGVYSAFGTNVPAITDRGLYAGGQRQNKCRNFNANPTDLTGVSKAGDAAAMLTVVDDSAELAAAGLDGICTSGMAFKLDNSAGVASAQVYVTGNSGNTNPHTMSVYMRSTGSARMVLSSSGGTGWGQSGGYVRRSATVTPANSTQQIVIEVAAGVIAWFILNQLEEGAFASPPIVTAGSAATRAADAITNPNFATHAATFGLANGMAALARVNLTRLSDSAARRIATFGTAADGAYIEFTTSNTFKAVLRKSSADAVTLESGVVGSTGVYDVTATLDPGAYALAVSGGIAGDTDASAETLPAAIASACYIGHKEDTTLHLNGPLERLAMWRV